MLNYIATYIKLCVNKYMTKIGLILGILLPITKIYEHKYNEFLGYYDKRTISDNKNIGTFF